MAKNSLLTQVEQATNVIRKKIYSGQYAPSTHLVLRSVASDTKMSVIPIRDALARLQQEGLVEGESGRGWRVSEYDQESLKQVSEVREALECQVVRLASVRATTEDLEELELLARQADRETSPEKVNLIDGKFHLRLAEAAKNPRLYTAIEREHVLELIFGDPVPSIPNNHCDLVHAIASGDPDVAESEMRKHLAILPTLSDAQKPDK